MFEIVDGFPVVLPVFVRSGIASDLCKSVRETARNYCSKEVTRTDMHEIKPFSDAALCARRIAARGRIGG